MRVSASVRVLVGLAVKDDVSLQVKVSCMFVCRQKPVFTDKKRVPESYSNT